MAFARPQAIQQFAPIGDDGTDGQAILVDSTGRILAVIQTALPAGDAAIGRFKITDGTNVASVVDLATRDGLSVVVLDGSGDQITTFGGGTQYTEAATDASITGTAALAEGPGDALTPFLVDASQHLPVDIAADS